jgi:peroxiredoxin (alkyl hydroperoxide reductase subunit C)
MKYRNFHSAPVSKEEKIMLDDYGMVTVGDSFPIFTLNGVNSQNEMIEVETSSSDWSVIYFYPKDFTFICPTEIAGMDMLVNAANVIGISGDNEFCKLAWKTTNGMIREIDHTLAADCGLQLSNELGIVDHENGVCYRATFIVDPDGIIQHVSVNALDTGRNPQEVLRTLHALKAGGLTGCEWNPGDEFVA